MRQLNRAMIANFVSRNTARRIVAAKIRAHAIAFPPFPVVSSPRLQLSISYARGGGFDAPDCTPDFWLAKRKARAFVSDAGNFLRADAERLTAWLPDMIFVGGRFRRGLALVTDEGTGRTVGVVRADEHVASRVVSLKDRALLPARAPSFAPRRATPSGRGAR
jgi:hypothetical protein